MRTFLLILALLPWYLSLFSYEQGTYFFCLTSKSSQAPAGRIPLAADLFREKAQEEAKEQKIAAKVDSHADVHTRPNQSLDLGALAETHVNKKVDFFDTSKLFQKKPDKSKTKPKED